MKRGTPRLIACALALPLLALTAGPSSQLNAADDDLVWLRVEVNDRDSGHNRVTLRVPLSLVEIFVDSVNKKDLIGNLERNHPEIDLSRMWRKVRRMDTDEFLTVDTEHESVRVWKDAEFFRLKVREDGRGDRGHRWHDEGDEERGPTKVDIAIPLEIMDYILESRGDGFDFQEMLSRIRHMLPLTLVQVEEQRESVKVWLEEN